MRNLKLRKRSGITLVFVISLIALFLLMGTAFVVLASDFLKSSRIRLRSDSGSTLDGSALVEKAMFEVLRGPELTDVNSPLRFNDLLSDQYGYGVKGFVDQIEFAEGTNNQILRIALTDGFGNADRVTRILDGSPITLNEFAEDYVANVFSFVSGPMKGNSSRIFTTEFSQDGRFLFYLPVSSLVYSADQPLALESMAGSQVVINNRDFSGNGPGFNPDARQNQPALSPEALSPNRKGQDLQQLIDSREVTDNSTNEPWDAADTWANMFLSGRDEKGNIIPSFHRESLPNQIGSRFSAFTVDNSPEVLRVDVDNDGLPDSVWIDVGFPMQSDQESFYKPMVAYKIVDLDGRLNINAHGNLADADQLWLINNFKPMLGGEDPRALPRGLGFGPAEISLKGLFQDSENNLVDYDAYRSLINGRYGSNQIDGGQRNDIQVARTRLFGHPFDVVNWSAGRFGTVGNLFASSPMDIHGRFALGFPLNAEFLPGERRDGFRDLNFPNHHNAMPVIDILSSNLATPEFSFTNYGLALDSRDAYTSTDNPYTLADLEKILRPNDIDSQILAGRLWYLPNSNPDNPSDQAEFWNFNRDLVTTASFEVPVSHQGFHKLLFRLIARQLTGNGNTQFETLSEAEKIAVRQQIRDGYWRLLFAPELFLGQKMNVNRPFGNGYDDSGNGIVDSPDEAPFESNLEQRQFDISQRPIQQFQMDLNQDGVINANEISVRTDYARHLYCLMMLVTDDYATGLLSQAGEEAYLNYTRTVAQWAVNAVDFRDPDSIMTRFDYDPFPFNGNWSPSATVWGVERPELLITETFAAHARRIETDDSEDPPVHEQRLRPEPFAFIELYNPWTQNSLTQQFDAGQYDATQGVDLQRRTPNDDPVWRIRIDRPDRETLGELTTPPDDPELEHVPLRYVYFVDPGVENREPKIRPTDPDVEVFYSDQPANGIRPGTQAVIGTEGRCYLGRLAGKTEFEENPDTLELKDTTYLELNTAQNRLLRRRVEAGNAITEVRNLSAAIPVNQVRNGSDDQRRRFSVSDPFGGYPAVGIATAQPVPDGFRYFNPLPTLPDDQTGVDQNRDLTDIIAINQQDRTSQRFRIIRLQRLANPTIPWNPETNPYLTIDSKQMDLLAFNGVQPSSSDQPPPAGPSLLTQANADSLERNGGSTINRLLWPSLRGNRGGVPPVTEPAHYLEVGLRESLGRTNDLYQPLNAGQPFPWLTWNNRPFASHLELVNVPFWSADQLLTGFSIFENLNPYGNLGADPEAADYYRGNFGHLLNFFHHNPNRVNGQIQTAGTPSPEFYRIMDLLEVPSPYVGTTHELLPDFGSGSFLNPYNSLSRFRVPGKINLNTIYDRRVYEGLMDTYATFLSGPGLSWQDFVQARGLGTPNENPFRPANAGNYQPPGLLAAEGPQCTEFRGGKVGNPQNPLLDFTGTSLTFDSERNAYFRNAMRQRMGNLVTTRSSVFAIWVMVGYFECDSTGALLNPQEGGRELGAESGQVRRHRGFFIVDRSIPVAYEPGKNHNIEKAILLKTMIE